MAKIAPGKAAACPAPAAAAVDQPRAVEPPAVTVVPAVKREFVDRLFVSGTLVAREEAQVAARIDGLTIVEVDAEDGDRVKEGQVLARLDRTPARRAACPERRGDQARRCGDRPGGEPDRAVSGAGAVRQRRFRPRAQARGRRHGRLDHRAARDGDEDGAGPTGRRPERARRRRGRPQEPRRGAAGVAGAHRPDGGQGARRPASSADGRPSWAPPPRAPASRCSASSRTERSISRPTCPSSRSPASPSACRRN